MKDERPDSGAPKTSLRRAALIILVGAAMAAMFYGARPAYHRFKGWRARRLASEAERGLQRQDWAAARQKAEAAFLLAPKEPEAVRALARVMTQSTNSAALALWQQLIVRGQATADERRTLVELAIRTGAFSLAGDELRKLLADAPNLPANAWLASQLFAALGDYPQTVYYAARAQTLDPQNKRYRLFRYSLLYNASDATQRSEARTNLWELARDKSDLSLEALGFLARRPDLTPAQRMELIVLLKEHPLSGINEQLLGLDQTISVEPERRPQILDQALQQYAGSDAATLGQWARWLNQHEEFNRALTAVPLAVALKNKDLFLIHLDALARLGQWQQLAAILETNRVPFEAVYTDGFQARCAKELGKGAAATVHWNRARFDAERNPEQLTWLAFYAENCSEWEQARLAWRSLLACAFETRPVYQALERLTEKTGTTVELRQLLGEMVKRWPQDPGLRNDYAYLSLLLGDDLAESRRAAEELVSRYPDSLAHRTTLALACYRMNDTAAARRVYEGRDYDWRLALPGHRAVYAAVLAANGQAADARNQVRTIPREHLRQEELELVRPLLE